MEIKAKGFVMALVLMHLCSLGYSTKMQQHFDQTIATHQDTAKNLANPGQLRVINPKDYAKGDTENVAAKNYYDNPEAMEDQARAAKETDQSAIAATDVHLNKRQTIDANNPAYKTALSHQENAGKILSDNGNRYHCTEVARPGSTKTTTATCQVSNVVPMQCVRYPEVKILDVPYQTQATFSGQLSSPTPRSGQIIVPESGTIISAQVSLFNYGNNIYSCFQWYWGVINGTNMSRFHPNCGGGTDGSGFVFRHNQLNIPAKAGVGVPFRLGCTDGYCSGSIAASRAWTVKMNVTRYKKEAKVTWSNTCNPIYLNQCKKLKEVCIEPKATRKFGTQAVTLDCWNYQQTYQCGNPNINTCGQYQSCNFIQKICSQKIGEYCVQHKETYQCIEEHCDSNEMLCGKPNAMCLDGDCQSDEPEPNTGKDFAPTVSALAGIFAAGQDLKDQQQDKAGSFAVFKGKVADCGKAGLGIYNCCAENGGVVKNCSDGEKVLYNARKKGFATQVGEYCAKRVLGACVLWHEGWCVFESKLARIINEQGRGQLGISFGNPEHPNCQGLTPEMLQQIKFDQVDFQEVFADIASAKAFPNPQKLNESIANTAKSTLQGLGK